MSQEQKNNSCRLFKRCGGCQLAMSYDEQLSWKQERVTRRFGKYTTPEAIIGMDKPYNYRNKVTACVRTNSRKDIISGVFQSSTNTVIATDDCMLEDKKAQKIVKELKKLMRAFKIMPYDMNTGRGLIRYFLIRHAAATGEIMVCIVTASPIFPAKNNFIKALLKACPEVTTVVMNVSASAKLMLSSDERVMYGKGYIEDILCGKRFRISARSFYQVNPIQTQKLYETAIEFADLKSEDTLLDAYCGIGTIGIVAAQKVKRVIGVENNKDAIRDAKVNAKLNKVNNISFYCADAGEFVQELSQSDEKIDVVIMDPARQGSGENFLTSVTKLSPRNIVYVSCNIETQERDIKLLIKDGYKIIKVQPVDMFPHTNHIECVILLTRK